MSEFFSTPDDLGEIRQSELQSSLGERLSAQAADTLDPHNSLSGMYIFRRAREAMAGGFDRAVGAGGDVDAFGGVPVEQQQAVIDRERAAIPDTSIDDAKARVKQEGLEGHLKLPDQASLKTPVLDLMVQEAHERRDREFALAHGPQGFLPGALGLVTSLGVGMIDPVNMAAFSIPVLGEARWGKMLASAGDGLLARGGVRALQGGAQGAVGTAVLQPADWWLHTQDGEDYTFSDALKSIALGAGMGAGFHAAIGGVGDIRSRMRGKPLAGSPEQQAVDALRPQEPAGNSADEVAASIEDILRGPVMHPAEVLADLPPAAREDVLRAAVADVVNGRPVRAGEMLDIAADHDPRIAESFVQSRSVVDEFGRASLSAESRDWPKLPEGAELSRHGDFGPEVAGLDGRWTEAVGWLREAQSGDARAVLRHPDVPGPIDVVWGNKDFGLEHIIAQHPEVVADLPERLARMSIARVAQEGRPGERIVLTSPDRAETAVIRTSFDGEKKTWLLTAYTPESNRPGRGGGTTGSPSRGPAQSPASPEGNVGRESPSGNSHGALAAAAAEDPRWSALAEPHEDPQAMAESRAAEAVPEPSTLVPESALTAAEKAAADAEEAWRKIEPHLDEKERAFVTEQLKQLKEDSDARSQIITEGAACLAAAFA